MSTERPIYKIPVSVLVVIHTPRLEVLLLERADAPGFWQSVTGSLDHAEETPAQAAQREVAEETGLILGQGACLDGELLDWALSNVYEIYPRWRQRYAPGVTHNTEHVFGLRLPRAVPVQLCAREHTRYDWLPWQEAADRCFSPSNAEAILTLPRMYPSP